jgi:hypothetical protein
MRVLRAAAVAVGVAALLASTGLASPRAVSAGRTVVLGSKRHPLPSGYGFGTAAPGAIFNGGDPSGLVTHIDWTSWGQSVAAGRGLNAIFMPQGGYYAQLVTIQLRAYDLGRCTPLGPLAYRRLSVREPSRPGGPPGPWVPWGGGHGTIC